MSCWGSIARTARPRLSQLPRKSRSCIRLMGMSKSSRRRQIYIVPYSELSTTAIYVVATFPFCGSDLVVWPATLGLKDLVASTRASSNTLTRASPWLSRPRPDFCIVSLQHDFYYCQHPITFRPAITWAWPRAQCSSCLANGRRRMAPLINAANQRGSNFSFSSQDTQIPITFHVCGQSCNIFYEKQTDPFAESSLPASLHS